MVSNVNLYANYMAEPPSKKILVVPMVIYLCCQLKHVLGSDRGSFRCRGTRLFSMKSRLFLGPNQVPIQWVLKDLSPWT
jgi:hypothetical protein